MNTKNNISQEQLEAIERYLGNTMEQSERQAFDTKLKEDLPFRTSFEDTKALLLGIESAALQEQFEGFHEEIDKVVSLPARNKNKSLFGFISVAASIAILMGAFWFMNSNKSTDQIFAKHFTPDPGLPTVMSTSNQYEFYDGMVDYKMKEYPLAIQKWEKLLLEKPNNDTLSYFLGVAHLANGSTKEAISYLQKTTLVPTSYFNNDSFYFLGLAQLKAGQEENAVTSFQKSSSPLAKEVLKDIQL